jgi:hypothetical protein
MIIFANDARVIISSKNEDDFCMLSNKVLSQMKADSCKQAAHESRQNRCLRIYNKISMTVSIKHWI